MFICRGNSKNLSQITASIRPCEMYNPNSFVITSSLLWKPTANCHTVSSQPATHRTSTDDETHCGAHRHAEHVLPTEFGRFSCRLVVRSGRPRIPDWLTDWLVQEVTRASRVVGPAIFPRLFFSGEDDFLRIIIYDHGESYFRMMFYPMSFGVGFFPLIFACFLAGLASVRMERRATMTRISVSPGFI